MNTFKGVHRALAYEIQRQSEVLAPGRRDRAGDAPLGRRGRA